MARPNLLPVLAVAASLLPLAAQDPGGFPGFGGPGFGGPGFGGPGGGPMGGANVQLVERFDADKNGRLDRAEREAAKKWLADNPVRRGPGGPGGRGGRGGPGGPGAFGGPPGFGPEGENQVDPDAKGQTVRPADVVGYADRPFFDQDVVRTIFLDFEGDDWAAELDAFYRTDVQLPARLTVDGKTYADVGVGFRGNTSYGMVRGKKKSFDLRFDFADEKQHVHGLSNLDLLNCNGDPTYMREALHGWLANQFLPAQRVALVRVVCNGEDFGIYAAVEQFDKAFLKAHYGTAKGNRFKVLVDFSGNGGLRFLGDDAAAYRRNYELKSKDDPAAWSALVDLCAVLEQTATEDLERILPQHLDVDDALWFLAVDNAVGDDDGYHSRASDYVLYRDPAGRFHPIARDNNEILLAERGGMRGPGGRGPGGAGAPGGFPGGGPGGRGPGGRGPGGPGGGMPTSPLAFADRDDRPLLKRLLQVPRWRERYLADIRAIAQQAFAPEAIGPRIDAWQQLIGPIMATDVHAPMGARGFEQGVPALKNTIAERRKRLLEDASLAGAWPTAGELQAKTTTDANGGASVHVTCRAGGEGDVRIGEVVAHSAPGEFGAMTPMPMFDDGEHGDGATNDGVYGASIPAGADGVVRVWVEVTAAKTGRVACLPAGGGALPLIVKTRTAK
ncbi:MAG: CotH kinase family protein [Planctomycetota bacterium]